MNQRLTLPRGLQIIKCKSISLVEKDIVVIEDWKDFLWLLGGGSTVFKLKKSLYSINGEVAFIFELGIKEV